MVDWPKYLAPWIDNLMPGTGQEFMYFVGVVEIVAGLVVLVKPRYGGYLVAAWLAGIVINLPGSARSGRPPPPGSARRASCDDDLEKSGRNRRHESELR